MVTESNIEVFLTTHEPQINRHFNRDRQITTTEVPSLIAPVKVDAIGRNERPVIVQFLDLNRRVTDIKYELAQVLLLSEAFEEQNIVPKTFLIAETTAVLRTGQQAIWKQLRNHKKFESLPVSEAEKVIEYAEEHGVLPLI